MRAMLLRRIGAAEDHLLSLEQIEDLAPGAGQLLIEVLACGVCRTDLHIAEGEVPASLPLVPGHQVAGRVAAIGRGVGADDETQDHAARTFSPRNLAVGDTVGVGWLASTCGACSYCAAGNENLCPDARFTGRDVHGGYAQRIVADARYVYPLPASFSPVDAAPLLCAGIIGYRSLKLSGITPGGRLGLVGFGASAHLAIQVARHWRCDVYAFTREERHRRMAQDLGAVWAGGAEDDPGVQLDAAVIFAPAGALVPQMLAHLRPGGTLAINAIHMSDMPSFPYGLLYGERTVRSVANFTRQDAREFLALAEAIPIHADVERYRLEGANDALLRVKRGDVHGAAVLVIDERATGM